MTILKFVFFFTAIIFGIVGSIHSQIVINEVNAVPAPDGTAAAIQSLRECSSATAGSEYIELYNNNPCDPIDISCYIIGTRGFLQAQSGTFRFPQGTIVPPLGFVSIGGPNSNATFNLYDFCGTPNMASGNNRWYLNNGNHYVMLYDASGTAIDAVYWSNNPNDWGSISTISNPPNIIAAGVGCSSVTTLEGPSDIPQNDSRVSYAGAGPSLGQVMNRVPDGSSNWQNNGAPSINNCNDGNCASSGTAEIPEFDAIDPICEGENLDPLPNTSINGISGTWSPAINNSATTTYTFTPNPDECAESVELTIEVISASVQPPTACYETANFNDETCEWEITGTQPSPPEVACYETATFNTTNCNWVVTGNPPLTPTVSSNGNVCEGEDAIFTITGTPNTIVSFTGVTSNPSSPVSIGANGTTNVIVNQVTSSKTLTITTYEFGDCINPINTSATVSVIATPELSAGNDISICEGEAITLTATNPDGADISWSNNITDGEAFIPPVGTTTYTVVADLEGCIVTDQVTVTVTSEPTINAGNDFTVCEGETIILSASGATNYTWSNNVSNGVPFQPPLGTTTYTVTGTTNGCEGSDQVTVTVEPNPTVSFDVIAATECANAAIELVNTNLQDGASCLWNISDGTVLTNCDQVQHTFSQTGCFDVSLTVTSANGCQANTSVQNAICLTSGPIADFTPNPFVTFSDNPFVQFNNESVGATSYTWFFGDANGTSTEINPSYTYPFGEEGFYDALLIATDANGCVDTTIRRIEVRDQLIYYVPNAFTPDNDSFNELFQPVFTSGFDPFNYKLLIFNRWGEVLFESNNAAVGWDGTYGGKVVQEGTYVWKIEFRDKYTDKRYQEMGHVTLLK